MPIKAIEKAAALLLLVTVFLALVGMFSLPSIFEIANAQARIKSADLVLRRASRLTGQEDEIRDHIQRINQALENLPGWSENAVDILIAAEATKLITTLFERNEGRLRRSRFLTPEDNDGEQNTRIQFVGEVSQRTLHNLLFELEFGDAPMIVEQAIIRGLRLQQRSVAAGQRLQAARPIADVTLEVTIAWRSFRK